MHLEWKQKYMIESRFYVQKNIKYISNIKCKNSVSWVSVFVGKFI